VLPWRSEKFTASSSQREQLRPADVGGGRRIGEQIDDRRTSGELAAGASIRSAIRRRPRLTGMARNSASVAAESRRPIREGHAEESQRLDGKGNALVVLAADLTDLMRKL